MPSSFTWCVPKENMHVILEAWQYFRQQYSHQCYQLKEEPLNLFALSIIAPCYSTGKAWKSTTDSPLFQRCRFDVRYFLLEPHSLCCLAHIPSYTLNIILAI